MKRLLIAVMFTLLLSCCSKTLAKSFVDALVWWHMDEYDTGVVYTEEDYDSVVSILASNSKLRASYDNALKEYKTATASSAWIEKEILTRVQEVKDKYQQLDRYCHLFATEYLPLANNDTAIAMAFIGKAYSLNEEAQSYVLANYNSQRS